MGEKKKNEKNGEKKEENPVTVVLKVDMHCEGCANKIIKCIKGFEGVQTVKAEIDANKLTVLGKIDPSKLREKLANKSKKKVDLISPNTKKEKESKPDDSSNNKKPDDNKKPKEAPVTTAVLKVVLHCQGCIEKIQRSTSKFKGVHEMSMDKQKDLVTVKGLMDVKALCQSLSERLKRPVEIVPPKKEKDNDKDKDKKGGGGGGGDGEKNEGGEGKKKKKGGGGGGGCGGGGSVGGGDGGGDGVHGGGGGGGGGKMEGNKMEYMPMAIPGYGYGYGYGLTYGYGPGGFVGEHLHAPQLFSDENPNACYIM